MSHIRYTSGKCYLPNQGPIRITKKKDLCLEPENNTPLIEPINKTVGNGLSELQQKVSSLSFLDDTPIKPVLKGERKKRNISFVY